MIKNFTLIIDTREKMIAHIINYCKANNIKYIFKKLQYGDYSFFIEGKSYENLIVVERKASINELAGNLVTGKKGMPDKRQRFKNEFLRAKQDNAKILLLIEEKNGYQKILNHEYISKLHPNAFLGTLNSWIAKKLIFKIYFGSKNNSLDFMINEIFLKYLNNTL